MRFASWACLSIGVLMLAQWAFFLMSGQVPELRTEPIRIAFHLAGEAATALTLVVAGVGLLRGRPFAPTLALVGNGMLVYTVIVSPGYFAQRGEWPLVAMFALLLVVALASIVVLARGRVHGALHR